MQGPQNRLEHRVLGRHPTSYISQLYLSRHIVHATNQFFSCNIFFLPLLSLFYHVGFLIRKVGSLNPQPEPLLSQVSCKLGCKYVESRRSKSTASSVLFSSAEFKIVVPLCADGTQPMADTAVVCNGGTASSPAPFEVADRQSCDWLARAGGTSVTG